jgi:hypothetical protein
MLVREEVFFATQLGIRERAQALCSERLCSPMLHFSVRSDPVKRVRRFAAVFI